MTIKLPFKIKPVPYWFYNLARKLGLDVWMYFDGTVWLQSKDNTNPPKL